jgi:Holliday junction resolvasome RuvABC ATP-dependent DNA helicase subunit
MENLFSEVIGQTATKRKLSFYLSGYKATQIMPNIIFVAPKGHGKTHLAKELAKLLTKKNDSNKPKSYIEINCSTIKNVNQFINNVIIPFVNDREVTVLMDEASELPNDVTMMLLSLLNPNKENKNKFYHEDFVIEFDFSKQTFLFATSEPHKVFHALLDRLTRIDLEEYSVSNLGDIMLRTLQGVKFEDGVLNKVTNVLRGNARQAQKMANDISIFLKTEKGNVFSQKEWEKFRTILDIKPLGLHDAEIRLLKIIAARKSTKLTSLAAIMGMSRSSIQQDVELYLQKNNLISILPEGRSITQNGQYYIKLLESLQCG